MQRHHATRLHVLSYQISSLYYSEGKQPSQAAILPERANANVSPIPLMTTQAYVCHLQSVLRIHCDLRGSQSPGSPGCKATGDHTAI